ncbi:hypothetical protein [Sinorhizobium medicae]|uniref:hypothetical protein n=1 Tax=Sinorhizobium medicae TaxID=110321 RepID=UPI000FD9F96D|nr:hypothetical protein [Sinorhizobium medicae]RVO78951.1 hypothetical protein CN084_11675 [Sinorhizobium medicae]
MELFHVAPIALRSGSVIEPGNFGRILALYRYNPSNNGWMMARELAFEMERLRIAPEAPSRMQACFALPSLDEAQRYRSANAHLNVILEVELSEPEAACHYGFLQHFDGMHDQLFIATVKQRAEDYWTVKGEGDREVVTASGLRVVRQVA